MDLLDKYIIARWAYAIGVDFIDDVEYRYLENGVIVLSAKDIWGTEEQKIPLLLVKR